MQATLETISASEHKLTITVPSAVFEKRIKKRLRKAASGAQLKGYRRGKAPLKEMRRQLDKAIREEVAGDMVLEHTSKAMQRAGIEPVGGTRADITNMQAGSDLEFVVTFRVLPEIELGDLSKIVVYEPQAEVTDEDVERLTLGLRRMRADYHEVRRPAREGDRVTVDLTTTVNGERVVKDDYKGIPVPLDEHEEADGMLLIDECAEALRGAELGDVVPLPATTFDGDVKVVLEGGYEMVVRKIEEPDTPAFDADFVKSFGINSGDLDEYRTAMRERMIRQTQSSIEEQVEQQLINAVVAMHRIPVPDILVRKKIKEEKNRKLQSMWDEQHGTGADSGDYLSDEEYALFMEQAKDWPDEPFREQAEKNIIFGLVLDAVVKTESLTLDEALLRREVDELMAQWQDLERDINLLYSDESIVRNTRARVLDKQAIQYILTAVVIKPIPSNFWRVRRGFITTPYNAEAAEDSSTQSLQGNDLR